MPEDSREQDFVGISPEVALEHLVRHRCPRPVDAPPVWIHDVGFERRVCPEDECSLGVVCSTCNELLFLLLPTDRRWCAGVEELRGWLAKGLRIEL